MHITNDSYHFETKRISSDSSDFVYHNKPDTVLHLILRFFPVERLHQYDGNILSIANKTDSKFILLCAWRDTLSAQYERYQCCKTYIIDKDTEEDLREYIPAEQMLYEIVNSWDTVYVVKDDTIRLFYSCNHLTHKGDSIHDIYNINSWKHVFYVYGNDTFDILRFTFVDEDFLHPDTIAIPYRYLVEKTKGESRWFKKEK